MSLVRLLKRTATRVVVLLMEISWLAPATYAHKTPGISEVKTLATQGRAYYLQLLFIFSHKNHLINQAWKLHI